MALVKQLDADLVTAMKARDQKTTTTLRSIKADVKNILIAEKRHGEEPTDDDVTRALISAAKRRKDSLEQYQAAGRTDLADIEAAELEIIQKYLPQQMSEAEVREVVAAEIERLGIDSMQKVGALMKELMPRLKGKADGKLINAAAREILAQQNSNG